MGPGEVSVHEPTDHFTSLHKCVAAPGHAEGRALVKSYSYRERDYAFAQLMLTLRTTLGLTQAGLAEPLGVSRRAVAEWEGGLSYPKAERLKAFIALCVQQHAFAAGREEEEIRALWKAARQKVLLDEDWLRGLLAPAAPLRLSPPAGTPAAHAGAEAVAFPRVDWVEALDVSHFAGREVEVAELSQWIVQERCRLETLLEGGDREGGYLPGYEGYGRLIGRLAESAHQSCVLVTSREKPMEIEALEGGRSPVRSLRLAGIDEQAAQELLSDKELSGTPAAWQRLVAGYVGNPLALKIVAQAVCDLFGGDLDRFLQEGELVFNGVRPVLRQQVGRLSPLEHLLLTWLAVLREWTPLDTLSQVLHPQVLRSKLLEALEALSRRSLLERGQQASFSLQSVVMEYLTDELGERLSEEIVLDDPQQLRQMALEQAQAKDYIRQTQVRLLVQPLLERLRAELGADSPVEAHLLRLFAQFHAEDAAKEGYGPANVITLLKELRGHLRGLDLAQLARQGADRQA